MCVCVCVGSQIEEMENVEPASDSEQGVFLVSTTPVFFCNHGRQGWPITGLNGRA